MEYPTREKKGTRTLVQALDQWVKVKPDKIWACLPESSTISDGLRYVTMREVACAIDSFAWALKDAYGESKDFETIAYAGLNDLRYAVVFYAAIKCGYKTLMLSPKNTPHQNASLMQQTQCSKFFVSPELAPVAKAVQSQLPGVTLQAVEEFDHWLDNYTKHFPFDKPLEKAQWDPILVLHSSGSTGPPKPITINNGYFASSHGYMKPPPGRQLSGMLAFDFPGGGPFFAPFPCSHLAGFTATCILPVYAVEASVVFALPDRPATAHVAKQIMEMQPVRGTYAPPSIIEQVAQLPGGLDLLTQQEVMIYAGGPLSKACGDRLVKHNVKVATIFGSTETGPNKTLIPKAEDWNYLEFHPNWGNDMQEIMDGAHELVFHNDEADSAKRGIYWTHPHLAEYRTKDMFKRHPLKPELWTFYARNDDIIVFSNGEKWNPIPTESMILSSPKVSGVMVLGDGRQQPAGLVEPKEDAEDPTAFLDELWPIVEQANAQSPRQGVLMRSKLAVIEPGGLVRAAKGTVVRKLTMGKYTNVIDVLYGEGMNGEYYMGPILTEDTNELRDALQVFVRECAKTLSPLSHDDFNDEDDFYVNGLDSVQTVEFARLLKAGLKSKYGDLTWLTGQTIFDFPCVANLADALDTLLSQSGEMTNGDNPQLAATLVENTIAKYVRQMQPPSVQALPLPRTRQLNVILTGSTGSLGMRLLQALELSPQVSHIYCLDRSGDTARARIAAVMPSLQMSPNRVTFLRSQYGSDSLGLSEDIYAHLVREVDVIIHNAWKVDFNHTLASFEPVHIRGVFNFIRFSQLSPHRPRIMFVSSIASVGNYHELSQSSEPVPETVLTNPNIAQQMGYGQSKYVAERVLAAAPEAAGVPVTLLRAGQIAGPVGVWPGALGPAWNKAEWLPSIIETSKNLGYVPNDVSAMDWFPVDVLGKTIVDDLMMHDTVGPGYSSPGGGASSFAVPPAIVYNLSNPNLAPWSTVVETVQKRLGGAQALPAVSWFDWIGRVKAYDVNNEVDLSRFPVLKMLRFFEVVERHDGKSRLATIETRKVSETMRALEPVKALWMEMWLDQWGYGVAAGTGQAAAAGAGDVVMD